MAPPVTLAEALAAMQEFVDRVDRGEVRSKRTYAQFKALLARAPNPDPTRPYCCRDAEDEPGDCDCNPRDGSDGGE